MGTWRNIFCLDRFCPAEENGEPRLTSAELSRLLGDTLVREELQDVGVASLLPPVGSDVFRRFTLNSKQDIKQTDGNPLTPAAQLMVGKPLPFFLGAPPPELLYTPLEELDPYYQSQKTFLVLSRGNILHRFDADSSLYLLNPLNRLRTTSIKILLSPWFRFFVFVTLMINCLMMMMRSNINVPDLEFVFLCVYVAEVVLGVLSRGLCVGRFSFMRDVWNWIDLLLVFTGFPDLFVDFGKLSVFVTILRFLKVFSATPGLKQMVEALIRSARRMVDVFVITVSCLCLLAIVSTQVFMGQLRNKCVSTPPGLGTIAATAITARYDYSFITEASYELTTIDSQDKYTEHVLDSDNYFYRPGHCEPLLCGNLTTAGSCPEGFLCLRVGMNPNSDYTSYDSFFWSLLSVFRFLTQDLWDNLLQLTLQSSGKEFLLYLLLFIFPACFVVLSLLLAVVAMVTVDQDKAAIDRKKKREEEFRRIKEALMNKTKEEEEEVGDIAVPAGESSATVPVTEADADARPSSCWQQLRLWLRPLVLNPLFDLGIVLCLVVNIVIMATEHYPMTMQHEDFLTVSQLVFTGIFTVEMFLRISVLGLRGFFQVGWHILDFLVIVSSVLELSLANVSGLSNLRCLRLLRLLRLARWWPSLHLFLHLVWCSVQSLSLVLLVLVSMWTVMGLKLFRWDYVDNWFGSDHSLPRWHQADFSHSIMVVFRVLYGNWINPLWDCMEVSSPGTCVAYLIPMLVIGKLLVLALFLNLLLNSRTNDRLAALEDHIYEQTRTMTRICWWVRQNQHVDPDPRTTRPKEEGLSLTPMTPESSQVHKASVSTDQDQNYKAELQQKVDVETEKDLTVEECCCSGCPLQDVDASRPSCRIWSNFRRICLLIVKHKLFDGFMLFIILLSCMALVFEDIHLESRRILGQVLDWSDLVFTLVFLVEMLLKWFGFGFRKYFTDVSCWLDFLLLDVALLSLVLEALGIYCRPLRALRTLRTLSRFQGVKVVLRSLLLTLPTLIDVMLVGQFVWLIFGILAVNLFAGKFFYCLNTTSDEILLRDEVNNRTECVVLINENFTDIHWKRHDFHFDSVSASFLSLFLLGTSRSFSDLFNAATDSRGVDLQPVTQHSLHMSFFFLGFCIFGCFFSFLFFIRNFLRALQQNRHQCGGKHLFMTDQQQIYPEGFRKRFIRHWSCPPQQGCPDQSVCQSRLVALVSSVWFEVFMMLMVLLDVVALGVESQESSPVTLQVLYFIHFSLILVFLLEFILKVSALRRSYCSSMLNIIDAVVLALTIINIPLSDFAERYFMKLGILVVLRLVRLVRVLRFCNATRGIQTLFLGFFMSLPALVNIGFLLFIVTFSFSVVGMFSFGRVRESLVDDMVNFQTFWSSLTTMTTVAPSASWGKLLTAVTTTPLDCYPDYALLGSEVTGLRGECGSPVSGLIFFISYIVIFILLVVLLFIAVVLESFNARSLEDSEDPQKPQKPQDPQVPDQPISSSVQKDPEEVMQQVAVGGDPE